MEQNGTEVWKKYLSDQLMYLNNTDINQCINKNQLLKLCGKCFRINSKQPTNKMHSVPP